MDDKKYSIILADGTIIENLVLNGDNFISQNPIVSSMFDGNCSPVLINDGENEEIHENMSLVQITKMEYEYWFVLRDISKDELMRMKMQSDIEYVAMMAGVEL